MKILVIAATYSPSGVPLAQIRLADALARRGNSVKLIFCYSDPVYPLPLSNSFPIEIWNIRRITFALFALSHYLFTNQPDIVFTAEDHLNSTLAIAALLVGSKAKISASSRVNPFDTYSGILLSKKWFLKQLTKLSMLRINSFTCVSQGMVDQYRQVFSNPPHVCVYNPVLDSRSLLRMNEELVHPWVDDKSFPLLLAAGSLSPWKGFEYLIRALALIRLRRKVRLMILGDGPLRQQLNALIVSLRLTDFAELVGFVENPLKYFAKANVFVLSSLVEGMPNVLVEAMMCGCTPVATDCPTGPRELLHGGRLGYLVPMRDPEAMAAAIECALDFPTPKYLLDKAVAPFDENKVVDRHLQLLDL